MAWKLWTRTVGWKTSRARKPASGCKRKIPTRIQCWTDCRFASALSSGCGPWRIMIPWEALVLKTATTFFLGAEKARTYGVCIAAKESLAKMNFCWTHFLSVRIIQLQLEYTFQARMHGS